MEQLDQAMRAITLENPYFTAALYENFYGRADKLAKGFTRAELAYIQTAAPLRVVGDADNYPMESGYIKICLNRDINRFPTYALVIIHPLLFLLVSV